MANSQIPLSQAVHTLKAEGQNIFFRVVLNKPSFVTILGIAHFMCITRRRWLGQTWLEGQKAAP